MTNDELPRFGPGVRGVFAFRDGQMVQVEQAKKITVPAPFVHQDTIDEIESMATPHREKFTSKARYREHLRQNGFRESGGEHLRDIPKGKSDEEESREWKEEIEKAYYDVKYDRVDFTEAEKEQHLREQRIWKEKYKVRAPA